MPTTFIRMPSSEHNQFITALRDIVMNRRAEFRLLTPIMTKSKQVVPCVLTMRAVHGVDGLMAQACVSITPMCTL